MEKELLNTFDKELLLKDICARLPYGVKAKYYDLAEEYERCDAIEGIYPMDDEIVIGQYGLPIDKIKPYLFPLSSMTEEQTEELINLINTGQNDNNEFMRYLCRIEFYHKHHFDYRCLIPMGLALDAIGKNIY